MINRREFLKYSIGTVVATSSVATFGRTQSLPSYEDMNILLFSVEDLSSFSVGCYGNKTVKTPNIDALAKKGVLFERAYCQTAICNPSRASFCTGLRPDSTKVYGNDHPMDEFVPQGVPFITDILKQKEGVKTSQLGKLVHKWSEAERFMSGLDKIVYTASYDKPPKDFAGKSHRAKSFSKDIADSEDEFNFLTDRELQARLRRLKKERDEKIASGHPNNWEVRKPYQQLVAEQIGDSGLSEEQMVDGRIARSAADIIDGYAQCGQQFFMNIGFYSTHTPLLAPKKYVDMYDPQDMEICEASPEKDKSIPPVAKRFGQNYDVFNGMYPEYAPTPERQKKAIAAYYACSTYLDSQVGLVLDALKKNNLEDNTIVIFFSDHGFHLGEHGLWSKFTLFEQSTRVPFVVYVPGAKGNGQSCDEIVELVDVLPTVCDMWNLNKPSSFECTSFAPLLENPQQDWKKAAFSLVPISGLGRSVRTKRYRYSEWRKSVDIEDTPYAYELYDIENDKYEQNNIVDNDEYKDVVKEHRDMLLKGWKCAQPKGYAL